jgi:hypothetical protein
LSGGAAGGGGGDGSGGDATTGGGGGIGAGGGDGAGDSMVAFKVGGGGGGGTGLEIDGRPNAPLPEAPRSPARMPGMAPVLPDGDTVEKTGGFIDPKRPVRRTP